MRSHLTPAILLAAALLAVRLALPAGQAHAQVPEQSADDQEQEHRDFEVRRENITLHGHTFVAPLSLRSVPFDFAIPIAQLASRTQVGIAVVNGDRNVDQGPTRTHYALVSQLYDISVRFKKRLEVAVSPLGEVAAGLDGNSIITGGAAASAGTNVAVAYRLTPFERLALTLRAIGHFEWGYRANIEPLLYQAATNPIALVDNGFDAASVGSPSREIGAALALSGALALSARYSLQASVRLDAVSTEIGPWLKRDGTEKSGGRDLVYEAWNPSIAAGFGMYFGTLLLQPQVGYSSHDDRLKSPAQDLGPYSKTKYFVPAVQLMYVVGPVLQLGFGVGAEFAWTKLRDRYDNRFSTNTAAPFLQLVARYLWGETWPGH